MSLALVLTVGVGIALLLVAVAATGGNARAARFADLDLARARVAQDWPRLGLADGVLCTTGSAALFAVEGEQPEWVVVHAVGDCFCVRRFGAADVRHLAPLDGGGYELALKGLKSPAIRFALSSDAGAAGDAGGAPAALVALAQLTEARRKSA